MAAPVPKGVVVRLSNMGGPRGQAVQCQANWASGLVLEVAPQWQSVLEGAGALHPATVHRRPPPPRSSSAIPWGCGCGRDYVHFCLGLWSWTWWRAHGRVHKRTWLRLCFGACGRRGGRGPQSCAWHVCLCGRSCRRGNTGIGRPAVGFHGRGTSTRC